jgi:6,7-dimethyl-8-ribityllumazine synthase
MSYQVVEGKFKVGDSRIAVVVSRFNEIITEPLLQGTVDTLRRHGVLEQNIVVYKVPGAFEIPLICKKIAKSSNDFSAIIALGAIIRGATTHFELVAAETAKGLAQVGLNAELPIIFGVLTTETIEQAIERAGSKNGNKGSEAALAALEMIDLVAQL